MSYRLRKTQLSCPIWVAFLSVLGLVAFGGFVPLAQAKNSSVAASGAPDSCSSDFARFAGYRALSEAGRVSRQRQEGGWRTAFRFADALYNLRLQTWRNQQVRVHRGLSGFGPEEVNRSPGRALRLKAGRFVRREWRQYKREWLARPVFRTILAPNINPRAWHWFPVVLDPLVELPFEVANKLKQRIPFTSKEPFKHRLSLWSSIPIGVGTYSYAASLWFGYKQDSSDANLEFLAKGGNLGAAYLYNFTETNIIPRPKALALYYKNIDELAAWAESDSRLPRLKDFQEMGLLKSEPERIEFEALMRKIYSDHYRESPGLEAKSLTDLLFEALSESETFKDRAKFERELLSLAFMPQIQIGSKNGIHWLKEYFAHQDSLSEGQKLGGPGRSGKQYALDGIVLRARENPILTLGDLMLFTHETLTNLEGAVTEKLERALQLGIPSDKLPYFAVADDPRTPRLKIPFETAADGYRVFEGDIDLLELILDHPGLAVTKERWLGEASKDENQAITTNQAILEATHFLIQAAPLYKLRAERVKEYNEKLVDAGKPEIEPGAFVPLTKQDICSLSGAGEQEANIVFGQISSYLDGLNRRYTEGQYPNHTVEDIHACRFLLSIMVWENVGSDLAQPDPKLRTEIAAILQEEIYANAQFCEYGPFEGESVADIVKQALPELGMEVPRSFACPGVKLEIKNPAPVIPKSE